MRRVAAVWFICHVATAHAADGLGRLFFTPEQRSQLDTARIQHGHRRVIEARPEEAPAMTVMKYSGVVRRSDGRSTLWINDRAVHDSSRAESGEPRARVDESGVASISLPEEHRTIRLQVGQTADLSSGHVAESYTRHPATPRGGVEAVPAADPVLRLRRRRDRETDVPAADPMP